MAEIIICNSHYKMLINGSIVFLNKMGNGQSFRCLHVVVFDEQVVHITDSIAQVGRRPHGGGTYLAAWESHHHLDTVP